MPQIPKHILDDILNKSWEHAVNYKHKELVFDIYVNGEYKRTFVNDIQIAEFNKRIWSKDNMAKIEIVPAERVYFEVK